MHPMLNTAVKAARRAGQIINRASLDLDLLKVSKKQHNDFVTEVDKAAEAAIIETLAQPIRITRSWPKSLAQQNASPISNGLSTRSTEPPILSTASSTTACPSRWPIKAKSPKP